MYNGEGMARSQLDNYSDPTERPQSNEGSTRRMAGLGLEEDESTVPTAAPMAPVSPPSDPGITLLANSVGTAQHDPLIALCTTSNSNTSPGCIQDPTTLSVRLMANVPPGYMLGYSKMCA